MSFATIMDKYNISRKENHHAIENYELFTEICINHEEVEKHVS